MLDEYRIEQMGVGAYVDSIDEEVITVDQAVQRAFCWSNEMINNLIYSTVSPKRIYIPNIILAEEKREDGLTTTYVVDGGQRTEALRRFVFDGHKISKSIRNRYVTYLIMKRNGAKTIRTVYKGQPGALIKGVHINYDGIGTKEYIGECQELKDGENSSIICRLVTQYYVLRKKV